MGTKQTPYFFTCPDCGRHGHFVFADGAASEELFVYERGIEVLETAYWEGRLTFDEWYALQDDLWLSDIAKLGDAAGTLKNILAILAVIERDVGKLENVLTRIDRKLDAPPVRAVPSYKGCVLN